MGMRTSFLGGLNGEDLSRFDEIEDEGAIPTPI
jgi:hypothetical protein